MPPCFIGFATYMGAHAVPGRCQHELDRAKQRFVISLVVALLSMHDATARHEDQQVAALFSYIVALYALCSTVYAYALSKRPEGFLVPQYLFLALDPLISVAGLVLAPTYLAPLNFLLIVQIVRAGIRYGPRTLWFSWAIAATASCLTLPYTDYWLTNTSLLWSFAVVMLLTPALFVPLIRNLHAMSAELRQAATSDALTGLGNRRMLVEHLRLARERCIRDASMLAVLYIDIDNFKNVNDTLGHAIGDHFLETLATRLRKTTRSGDFLARVGGDEFVLLVEGLSQKAGAAQAEDIAKKLVATVQDCARQVAPRAGVSASVGIRCWTHDPDRTDHADIVEEADRAMYSAKRAGKSRVSIFSA